jgi:hypothetical protein
MLVACRADPNDRTWMSGPAAGTMDGFLQNLWYAAMEEKW